MTKGERIEMMNLYGVATQIYNGKWGKWRDDKEWLNEELNPMCNCINCKNLSCLGTTNMIWNDCLDRVKEK